MKQKPNRKKIRVNKEKEKIQQVTHWDLDYLSLEEIRDLYEQTQLQDKRKNKILNPSGKSNRNLSLPILVMVFFLLAGAFCVLYLV